MVPAISSLPCFCRCSTSCARIMSAIASERLSKPFSSTIASNCFSNCGCNETLKRVASSFFIGESMRVDVAQDVGTLQSMRKHQGFIVEHLTQRTVGHNSAGIQDDRARTHFYRELEVVRGD